MIAIVFAAGIGSRLKPFTDEHPKALAPVAGVPAIERVIRKLAASGAEAIVVNVYHFPQQIKDFLAENDFGVPVEISDESDMLLDTGGAIAKMCRECATVASINPDEKVIVHNADIITDFSILEMLKVSGTADVAILADRLRTSSRYFLFDKASRLRGWMNTRTGELRPEGLIPGSLQRAAFGGVHAITGKTLAMIDRYCGPKLHPFSIVDFYLDNCSELDIIAYSPHEPYHWFDIGTTEKLQQATDAMLHK